MLRLGELSDDHWRRINRLALTLAQSEPDGNDLRQRAVLSVIEGNRRWPRAIDPVTFLYHAMRSLISSDRNAVKRANTVALELVDDTDIRASMGPDEPSAEDAALMEQRSALIRNSVLALFEDDETTKLVLEGIMADMQGNELCELAGIDASNLATRRRLIQRRIQKAFPRGWHYDD